MKVIRFFLHSLSLTALLFCFGCSESADRALDEADLHFAGFYADYLVQSGVDEPSSEQVAYLDFDTLDSLLGNHELSINQFNQLTRRYQNDPLLWKNVLQQVRRNLEQKSSGEGR
ncbi:conserved hypothetical protein [Prosthecochloris aestuarii DSM 271]|uniref:DUF4296 domain-containing protein n=1 Tax=Prosthecochloris aestuarii (strain DSM 271 / SK 413) TaxID=290512 RepID=B4S836_PROA2|nr:conserved hypothetical protein [Prosthecochloris aestuarii DSM 271]